MKTKVAMAISLSGVLAAGTAAALVNTQVLNGGSSGARLAAAVDVQDTIPASSATTGEGPSVTIGGGAPVASPSPTQATYAIGEAGTVTLDTANGVLSIVAVTPAQGWVVSQSESDDSGNAEVKFESGDQQVEFHANLLYGVVNTSIESDEASGDDAATEDSVSSQGGDDDDHGDDGDHHEDDDERGDDD
jgi:hypothetical protein